MENRRPWNRNAPSSAASFSRSQRPRGQKFPANATQNPKPRNFSERRTPTAAYVSNSGLDRNLNSRKLPRDEEVHVEGPSYSGSLVGTCPHMCPERERIQREQLRDLAVFERLNGNHGKSSPDLAVKKFCRTISTKNMQPSDVRPLPVLEDTLNYLLNLLDSNEHPFEVVHDFVFDRTRSIRQDLTRQSIANERAVSMYEKMVKFHVISHYKLRSCMGNPIIASMHHLNMEQLTKTLTSLFGLYDANQSSNNLSENEAEFRSLYVLLHLGSCSKPTEDSLSLWFGRLSTSVLKSKEMCFARRILRSFRIGNYKHFLCTTAAQVSYLQYCIVEPYINEVRVLALACINFGGYKLHPYPLLDLSVLLRMKESDLESICNACGLEIRTDEAGNKVLPTKQTTFCHPKGEFQRYTFLGLEEFER
ncbi:SAC3 family protein C-like isoform X1 [Prosopis cineraria]|uniref:SAC3 family protein C-like isoform X1 n=1 Tax=Prosopis cineraria TaxID=364024 RepID=UPI00240F37E0|nr:SAC3 family protein C-like isoform X1 [Prosopis cineraria]XP_054813870.1 SAC3 family protein C-like isoform X1 [Prosopis cineraria]